MAFDNDERNPIFWLAKTKKQNIDYIDDDATETEKRSDPHRSHQKKK